MAISTTNGPRTTPSGRTASSPPGVRGPFVSFLKALKEGDPQRIKAHWGVEKASLSEGSGGVGGYLVPPDHSTRLLRAFAETSIVYPWATVVPMNSVTTDCPAINVETARTAGTSPFFGGMKFQWGFGQPPTETEPGFKNKQLTAWDLLGYANVSNQFLYDISTEGEDALFRIFAEAAAWECDYQFLNGDGVGKPLGILKCGAVYNQPRAGGGAIAAADIANMGGRMVPSGWNRSLWACSPGAVPKICQISSFQINEFGSWPSDLGSGPVGQLLTRPVFVTEKLPALGVRGDLIFIAPPFYAVGDRMQFLIDVSDQVSFRTNSTVFRIWVRIDGQPIVDGTITLADGATVVSPFVVLSA